MGSIAIAYPAFFGAFQAYFPELERYDPSKLDAGKYDLVIFSGGADINPKLYRQDNRRSFVDDARDAVEIDVYNSIIAHNRYRGKRVKMLGVCRGHQLINALRGGRLVQDIFFELKDTHGGHHGFSTTLSTSTIIKFFPNGVNSMHHQGVIDAGKDLTISSIVTLRAGRIIESTENDEIITVQWHPEFMDKEAPSFFNYIRTWANPRGSVEPPKRIPRRKSLEQLEKEKEEPTQEQPVAVDDRPSSPFTDALRRSRFSWGTDNTTSTRT